MQMILRLVSLAVISSIASAATPPSILNNSSHIIGAADAGLTVLGISHSTNVGPSSSVLAVNQTCLGGATNTFFLPSSQVINYAANTSISECAAYSTSTVTPSAPYQVINQSSATYTLSDFEQPNYAALVAAGIVYSIAYCGIPHAADYPPVAFVTVLPNNRGEQTVQPQGSSQWGCGYAQGIEFSIPIDGGGNNCPVGSACTWTPINGGSSMDVATPSATTEAMSAVLAALKFNHPQWTWGDVKSVLRATASNWSAGYSAFNSNGPSYGYGNINYVAANAYDGSIYLQPPGFSMQASNASATLTLYPFMTSRRSGEVIYAFLKQPVFPDSSLNNEYTYSQLSAIVSAYQGTLVYNSNGASGVQSVSYTPTTSADRYFVAFTVDNISNLNAAKFSRFEEFLIQHADFGSAKRRQIIIQSLFN